jgi:DNA repair exonuclease SbcCD ATPase subunit
VLREKSKHLNEEYIRSKQLSEKNREKDEEISELEQRVRLLEDNHATLQQEHRESLKSLSSLEQNKIIIQSYEASLEKFSVEVDRLNSILRKKMAEAEDLRKRQVEFEAKIKILEATER